MLGDAANGGRIVSSRSVARLLGALQPLIADALKRLLRSPQALFLWLFGVGPARGNGRPRSRLATNRDSREGAKK